MSLCSFVHPLSCAAQSRFKPRAARKWVTSRSLRLRPDIGGSLPSQGHFFAMPRPALLHGALAQRCGADHCRRCAWPCYAAAVPRLALPIHCAEIHRHAAALRVHDLPTRFYAVPWLCWPTPLPSHASPLLCRPTPSHSPSSPRRALPPPRFDERCLRRARRCDAVAVVAVLSHSIAALSLGDATPPPS